MNVNKIMLTTIVVWFLICGYIHTVAVDDFTMEQFIGVWYDLGIMEEEIGQYVTSSCNWFNISKQDHNDHLFHEVYHGIMNNGKPIALEAHGKLDGSTIRIIFPALNWGEHTYIIKSFNNGELIYYDADNTKFNGLVSRRPTLLTETEKKFEKLAKHTGVKVFYFDNDNCVW